MRRTQQLTKNWLLVILLLMLLQINSGVVAVFATDSNSSEDCYQLPELREASEQLSNGAFASAIKGCSGVIKKYPSCGYAYYYRAMGWQCMHHSKKAVGDIEKACELCPDVLGFWDRAAKIHEALGQWRNAADDLTRALPLGRSPALSQVTSGTPAPMLVDRARNYLKLGLDDAAFSDLTEYLKARPDAAEALFLRGLYYEHRSKLELAAQDFRAAKSELDKVPGGIGASYKSLNQQIVSGLKRISKKR